MHYLITAINLMRWIMPRNNKQNLNGPIKKGRFNQSDYQGFYINYWNIRTNFQKKLNEF